MQDAFINIPVTRASDKFAASGRAPSDDELAPQIGALAGGRASEEGANNVSFPFTAIFDGQNAKDAEPNAQTNVTSQADTPSANLSEVLDIGNSNFERNVPPIEGHFFPQTPTFTAVRSIQNETLEIPSAFFAPSAQSSLEKVRLDSDDGQVIDETEVLRRIDTTSLTDTIAMDLGGLADPATLNVENVVPATDDYVLHPQPTVETPSATHTEISELPSDLLVPSAHVSLDTTSSDGNIDSETNFSVDAFAVRGPSNAGEDIYLATSVDDNVQRASGYPATEVSQDGRYPKVETHAPFMLEPVSLRAAQEVSVKDTTGRAADFSTIKTGAMGDVDAQAERILNINSSDAPPPPTEVGSLERGMDSAFNTILESGFPDTEIPVETAVVSQRDGDEILPRKDLDIERNISEPEVMNRLNDDISISDLDIDTAYEKMNGGKAEAFSLNGVSPSTPYESSSVLGIPAHISTQISASIPSGLTSIGQSTSAILQPAILQTVDNALIAAKTSPDTVSVRLDPPEMGRIYIDFSFEKDGGTSAVIRAENTDVQSQLRDRSEHFLNLLKESGLSDVSLSFELYKDQDFGGGGYENQAGLSGGNDSKDVEVESSVQLKSSLQISQYNYVYDASDAGINLVL